MIKLILRSGLYYIPRERKRARVQSVSGKARIRSVSEIGAEPNLERDKERSKATFEKQSVSALGISPTADISRLWAGSWIRGTGERLAGLT